MPGFTVFVHRAGRVTKHPQRGDTLGWPGRETSTNHLVLSATHSQKGVCTQEGMKEMFYLTTHSTHFIYGYSARKPAADTWATLSD